jgi:Fe2+ transport system protein FeoA
MQHEGGHRHRHGQEYLTLFHLVTGDRAEIVRIHGHGSQGLRQRLLDMGVTRGTEVCVERHAPLGDPVEVLIKGYHLALRMNEAKNIEVRVKQP